MTLRLFILVTLSKRKNGVNISSHYNVNINIFRAYASIFITKAYLEFFLHPCTSFKSKKKKIYKNFKFLASLAVNTRMCHMVLNMHL